MDTKKTYLVYDSVLFASDALLLRTGNRAFRYGDGLFENMHFHKGRILFFDWHFERLLRAMAVKRLSVAAFIQRSKLHNSIIDLAVKNRIFGDATVRLSLFRKETDTFFNGESLQPSWIIETAPLNVQGFILNEKGLKVGVFTDYPKHTSPLSPFCTLQAEPRTLARLYAYDNGLNDCLTVNEAGKNIESTCSSLFWIKEKTVYTPKIASGCIDGIMRKLILHLLHSNIHFKTVETEGATLKELHNADELFLTDTIHGIRWVAALNEKRFYCKETEIIYKMLNDYIRSKTE